MTMISVDKSLFEDLLDFKLQYLSAEIQAILARWNYHSGNDFLNDARSGKLKEAEMDAIELRQLLSDQEKLQKIKKTLGISPDDVQDVVSWARDHH